MIRFEPTSINLSYNKTSGVGTSEQVDLVVVQASYAQNFEFTKPSWLNIEFQSQFTNVGGELVYIYTFSINESIVAGFNTGSQTYNVTAGEFTDPTSEDTISIPVTLNVESGTNAEILNILSAIPQTGTNVANPCSKYILKVTWEVNTDLNQSNFYTLVVYYRNRLSESFSIQLTNETVVSVDGNITTYEKEVEVNRYAPAGATIQITNSTGVVDEKLSFTSLGTFNLTSVLASTSITGVGTATINTSQIGNSVDLGLEYSINGVDYLNTNSFTNIASGSYTAYVRDAYGCEKTQTFVTNETPSFQVYNDFSFVSMLNSMAFAKVNGNLPSFENRLSYQDKTGINYKNFNYQFLPTQTGRFQFRSNYDVNKVFLLNCGVLEEEITVNKLTDNLNQQDIRDAKLFFENGFLYAYFDGTGNIYDSDGNVTGENNLNGDLLLDQVAGELIVLETYGVVEILEIVDFDGIGSVMKLNYNTPIAETTLKLTTYYDIDNFEVYEFDINFSLASSTYQIAIVTLPNAEYNELEPLSNVQFLSEPFTIVDEVEDVHFIEWKNSENNQISWDTGIECFSYFEKQFNPTFEPIDENEIYTTDTSKFMIESEVYESYVFHFSEVPLNIARQLLYLSSSDYLKIDGIFYTKEETPEIEAQIGSNLYIVKMKLTVSSNYNSNEREGMTTSRDGVDTAGLLKIE